MIEIPGRFAARIRRMTEHEIHFGITGEEFRRWHVDSMVAVSIAFFVLAAGAALQAIIPPPDHLPQALIPESPSMRWSVTVTALLVLAGLVAAGVARSRRRFRPAPDVILDFRSREARLADGSRFARFRDAALVIHVLGQSLDEGLHESSVTIHENAPSWCLSIVDLLDDGEYFARHRYLVGDGTLAEVEDVARQLLPYGFQGPKMRVAYVELADGGVIDGGMRLLRAQIHEYST